MDITALAKTFCLVMGSLFVGIIAALCGETATKAWKDGNRMVVALQTTWLLAILGFIVFITVYK